MISLSAVDTAKKRRILSWFLVWQWFTVLCTFQKLEECLIPNCFHLVVTGGSMDVLILTRPACRCVCVCMSIKHGCRSMLLEQACPVLCRATIVNDIVVMDVHQHGNGLANDEWDPHCSVAIVSIQETAHDPSQRNLKGLRFRGLSLWQWTVTEREELRLTWAIIPIKAHSLNIFRGTLTRYWRINEKHLIEHFLKHISNSSNNFKLLTCLFEFYYTSWQ